VSEKDVGESLKMMMWITQVDTFRSLVVEKFPKNDN